MLHPDAPISHCIRCHIKAIVAQLRLCAYECEGGPLENNLSFIKLAKIADEHPDYWPDVWELEVVVECDCPRYPVVARFSFDLADGKRPDWFDSLDVATREMFGDGKEFGCAFDAWEKAEEYIVQLVAGEVEPAYAYADDEVPNADL